MKGYRELFHRHTTYNREGETTVPFEKGLKTEKGTACTEGFSICGGLFSVREKLPNQPRPHDPTRWLSAKLGRTVLQNGRAQGNIPPEALVLLLVREKARESTGV